MPGTPPTAPGRQRRGRLGLLVLVLIFFSPLILAFLVYYGSSWRPSAHTNHGALISPPRPLPATTLAGKPVFATKWSLVYVGAGDCNADCRQGLYFMRQTYLSLGQLIPRMQRVFVTTGQCCDFEFLQREHSGLITVPASPALLEAFPQLGPHSVYVVDPLGNLMMRYDDEADPKGLRLDLNKLLQLSSIG